MTSGSGRSGHIIDVEQRDGKLFIAGIDAMRDPNRKAGGRSCNEAVLRILDGDAVTPKP
jgi:hypothetical protein